MGVKIFFQKVICVAFFSATPFMPVFHRSVFS